jgi:LysR family transcriptional regulator, glycine cleavage system transcriptional activator
MRELPPLHALRAFEAAARHMSFKDAAAELGLTPTAISHQVKLLEIICEQPLFRRRPRPLTLTAAGAKLFPVLRDGMDAFSAVLSELSGGHARLKFRVTTTNAFASRWLVPRLPLWRAAHPEIELEIIGTDEVVDLGAGDADVAVRYAHSPPSGLVSFELFRDRYWPMCSANLAASGKPIRRPADLLGYPFIHVFWPEWHMRPPTWQQWFAKACAGAPEAAQIVSSGPLFREELHAIDAMLHGQGIGMTSDILAERELARGDLVKLLDMPLPGFGFYLSYRSDHPRPALVKAFSDWLRSAAQPVPH